MNLHPAMLIIALMLMMAACVPAAESTAAEAEPLWTLPPGTEKWTADFFGVPVNYSIADDLLNKEGEVVSQGAHFPMSFDTDDGACNVRFSNDALSPVRPRGEVVRIVTGALTACYVHNGDLTGVALDENGSPVLADPTYPFIYLEACGPLLQPLGWPTADGDCELPDIRQGFIAIGSA